jgi:hypothetical protein
MSGLAITFPVKLFSAFVVWSTLALSGPTIYGRFKLEMFVVLVMLRVKFRIYCIPDKTCNSNRVFLSAIYVPVYILLDTVEGFELKGEM